MNFVGEALPPGGIENGLEGFLDHSRGARLHLVYFVLLVIDDILLLVHSVLFGVDRLLPVSYTHLSERKLLEGFRTIPLFQLPVLYGVGSRVRVYAPPPITSLGDWRFDNVLSLIHI